MKKIECDDHNGESQSTVLSLARYRNAVILHRGPAPTIKARRISMILTS